MWLTTALSFSLAQDDGKPLVAVDVGNLGENCFVVCPLLCHAEELILTPGWENGVLDVNINKELPSCHSDGFCIM
jgi:hypothetical protein